MSERFVLAQISDTHVRADDGGRSAERLGAALAAAAHYRADAIVLTGDLVNDEGEAEYAALRTALDAAHAPAFLVPGNHDRRELMRASFPDHAYWRNASDLSFAIDAFPVRLIGVDQVSPGETYGVMTQERADWLHAALSAAPDKPAIVALHHPPFHTHDVLFDRIGLQNADLFTTVIAHHPQVVRIICGHHHRAVVGQIAHAPVVVAPSTMWAFGLATEKSHTIAPKMQEPAGWMLHVWRRGAGVASHVMAL